MEGLDAAAAYVASLLATEPPESEFHYSASDVIFPVYYFVYRMLVSDVCFLNISDLCLENYEHFGIVIIIEILAQLVSLLPWKLVMLLHLLMM